MTIEAPQPLIDDLLVDAPVANLRRSATSGAMFVGGSQIVRMVTQFGSVIVIARLIGPQQTGISAMVAPLLAVALLVQDLGLGQATVQSKRLTYAQVGSIFWLGLAISAGFAVAIAASAPLVGRFYHTPEAAKLTLAVAALTLLSNAGSQPLALLNRSMRFGAIAGIEIAAAIGSLAGSIAIALWTHSYWAMFAANLLTVLITTVGAGLLARWWPGLPRVGAGVRALVRFGAGASVFNLTLLVARNLDNVLIGRVWGDVAVGLYDRGYKLVLFPLQQALVPVSRVMLPVLSRLQDEPERYRSVFLRCHRVMLLAIQPALIVLVVFAPALVAALLGPAWRQSADVFRALAGAGLMVPMIAPGMWLFYSQNRTDQLAQWGVFNAATTALGFVVSVRYGPVVLAATYSGMEIARAPMLWFVATRRGAVGGRAAFANALAPTLAIPFYAAAAYAVQRLVPVPPLVQIGLAGAAVYPIAAAALATTRSGRALLHELRTMGLGALGIRRR